MAQTIGLHRRSDHSKQNGDARKESRDDAILQYVLGKIDYLERRMYGGKRKNQALRESLFRRELYSLIIAEQPQHTLYIYQLSSGFLLPLSKRKINARKICDDDDHDGNFKKINSDDAKGVPETYTSQKVVGSSRALVPVLVPRSRIEL